MILKKEISEKAVEWGVPPETVDKDWVLGHFLAAFFDEEIHRNSLIFKGGTSLRKCRFPDYRFSEDLDFTSTDSNYIYSKKTLEDICKKAEEKVGIIFHVSELKELIFQNMLAGYQAKIKYWGANHSKNQIPPEPTRWHTQIKVEITLYEQVEFPSEDCILHHPFSDSDILKGATVPCYDLKEIMTEKIRSLVQRSYTAPRDLYDIWYLKDYFTNKDWKSIHTAFQSKMQYKGYTYTGVNQLLNKTNINKIKRAWHQSLEHQIQSSALPEIDILIDDLTRLFSKNLS